MRESAAMWLVIDLLTVFFFGTPDIHDAITGRVACGDPNATVTLKGDQL